MPIDLITPCASPRTNMATHFYGRVARELRALGCETHVHAPPGDGPTAAELGKCGWPFDPPEPREKSRPEGSDSGWIGSLIRSAAANGHAVVAGHFPSSLCVLAAQACARHGVPFFLVPMFHAWDPAHQQAALLDAARTSSGVFCLTPYEQAFFLDQADAPHAHMIGSDWPDELAPAMTRGARGDFLLWFDTGEPISGRHDIAEICRSLRDASGRKPSVRKISTARSWFGGPSREDIARLFSTCAGLIHTSHAECFCPRVLLAVRLGIPVIVTHRNHAAASFLRHCGLGRFIYESPDDAARMLLSPPPLTPDADALAFYSWRKTAARMLLAIGLEMQKRGLEP